MTTFVMSGSFPAARTLGGFLPGDAVDEMRLDPAQLLEGERDLLALPLELGDARAAARQCGAHLLQVIGIGVVEVEQLLDVGQREAQALAAQDELEAGAVARAIDALAPDALRRQQAMILVEADGAVRQRQLARQIADRIKV